MIRIEGLISEFGGSSDKIMVNDDGIAFYQPKEADLRPDLFCVDDPHNPGIPVWKRLRTSSMYCAMRFAKLDRILIRETPIKIINPRTKQYVFAWPVDRGPGILTRLIDVSPGVMAALSLNTDDIVRVEINTNLEFLVS